MHPIRIGIPLVFMALLVIYLLYLLFAKKPIRKIKQIGYLGLFFTAIWAVIYYVILR